MQYQNFTEASQGSSSFEAPEALALDHGFVETGAWLEGLDLTQPSRQSAVMGGDLSQLNARPGSTAFTFEAIAATLPQLWSAGWSWYTSTSQLP